MKRRCTGSSPPKTVPDARGEGAGNTESFPCSKKLRIDEAAQDAAAGDLLRWSVLGITDNG
ncbi:MAG: hypothetical protein HGA38_02435 [Candidatus Moranbacteria bacterium]|nr:hypothetical protein [Candidatus Moranbacteria bacterium]